MEHKCKVMKTSFTRLAEGKRSALILPEQDVDGNESKDYQVGDTLFIGIRKADRKEGEKCSGLKATISHILKSENLIDGQVLVSLNNVVRA